MTEVPPQSGEQVARRAADLFSQRLPPGWQLKLQSPEIMDPSAGPDFTATVIAPDGSSVRLLIEAKRSIERRDIARVQEQLRSVVDAAGTGATGVLAARYLAPQVRGELEKLGISYVDATGNMRVSIDSPAIFIGDRGEDRDPWRGSGRPRGTLKGEPAARVVRALVDYDHRWRVTELIKHAGTSVGATYRVVEYLESAGLITPRNNEGAFRVPDWQKLLRAWAEDSNTFQTNRVTRWIEPRGPNTLLARASENAASLDGTALRYAVTGSAAASEWAPYAPVRSVFIYVSDTHRAESEWGLRPTETAPNVLLIEPKSSQDVSFIDTIRRADGVVLAAPSQVAADLLNGPGRNPSEAAELLDWMSQNERSWRRSTTN